MKVFVYIALFLMVSLPFFSLISLPSSAQAGDLQDSIKNVKTLNLPKLEGKEPCERLGFAKEGLIYSKILCPIINGFDEYILSPLQSWRCHLEVSALKTNYDPNIKNEFLRNGVCEFDDTYQFGQPSIVTKSLTKQEPSAAWMYQIYNVALGFVNVLLVVFLFIIAFSNILHINIDTYSIKKMIPKVIFTAIAANLAIVIIALGSRMVDSLQVLEIFKPRPLDLYILFGGNPTETVGVIGTMIAVGLLAMPGVNVLGCCLGCLIFLLPSIILYLIALIMAFRPYIVYLATAVAPLAIACSILPQTQTFFKRWLGILLPWLFLPLVVNALIYIATIIPSSISETGFTQNIPMQIIGFYLPVLIRFGLLFLALRAPFAMEKDVSGAINWLGRKTGEYGMKAAGAIGSKAYQYPKALQSRISENTKDARAKAIPNVDGLQGKITERATELFNKRKEAWVKSGQTLTPETEAELQKQAEQEATDDIFKNDKEARTAEKTFFKQIAGTRMSQIRDLSGWVGKGVGGKEVVDKGLLAKISRMWSKSIERGQLFADVNLGPVVSWLSKIYGELNPYSIMAARKMGMEYSEEQRVKSALKTANYMNARLMGKERFGKFVKEIHAEDYSHFETTAQASARAATVLSKLADSVKDLNAQYGRTITPDEAMRQGWEDLNKHFLAQDSDYMYRNDPMLKGLNERELMELIVAHGTMKKLAAREIRAYRGGRSPAEMDRESDEYILGRLGGAHGVIPRAVPTGPEAARPASRFDTLSMFEKRLLQQTGQMAEGLKEGVPIDLGQAKNLVKQNQAQFQGLTMTDLDTRGDDILRAMAGRAQAINPASVADLVDAAVRSGGINIEQVNAQIESQFGGDNALYSHLKEYIANRALKQGMVLNTEDTQNVTVNVDMIQKQNLAPEQLDELRKACMDVSQKTQRGLSEAQYSQAVQTIRSQLKLGEETVNESTAAAIMNAIEAKKTENP